MLHTSQVFAGSEVVGLDDLDDPSTTKTHRHTQGNNTTPNISNFTKLDLSGVIRRKRRRRQRTVLEVE